MCLILFAINSHPKYKFVLAANRDEFFDRPTLPAAPWGDNKDVFGGRDERSKGTWLGFRRDGRFVAITNYRDGDAHIAQSKSRGELSRTYLLKQQPAQDFLHDVSRQRSDFSGYNLLLSDDGFDSIVHYSNKSDALTVVNDGLHGLSNALLNTAWPKVTLGKQKLSTIIAEQNIKLSNLIDLLADRRQHPASALPKTGVPVKIEKALSPMFIEMEGYGTRCSTAILVDQNNHLEFLEVTFGERGEVLKRTRFSMQLE
jgi:uncharacterized protein with NRDE domain